MVSETEHFIQAKQFLLNELPEKLKLAEQAASISTARLRVLQYLITEGPANLLSITNKRQVSAASMSRLVASLVSEGYLIEAKSKSDRRSKIFLVTTLARNKVAEENQRQMNYLNNRLQNLTSEEQSLILRATQLLQKVL